MDRSIGTLELKNAKLQLVNQAPWKVLTAYHTIQVWTILRVNRRDNNE